MSKRAKERLNIGQLSSEINITPMVDIVLVLLIFFLVITPVILYSFAANLPQSGGAASAWKEEQEFLVSVTDNNRITVNGVEVSEEDLVKKLEEFFPPNEQRERNVIFSGGKKASYERVIVVMDILKQHGVVAIGIR
ncbi:MAG: biopolymer transporter ExbD [Candidatus Latescibacterota bacterium]|jgi:biopolymer transport protein ExbD